MDKQEKKQKAYLSGSRSIAGGVEITVIVALNWSKFSRVVGYEGIVRRKWKRNAVMCSFQYILLG